MTINTYSLPQLYTLVVPDQCTSVTITGKGAGGGGTLGGAGDYLQATYTVAPGDVLYIRPGGQGFAPADGPGKLAGDGGFNGGGQGGSSSGSGSKGSAGGGGMSDVRKNTDNLANQIFVAGGGGGRGGSLGGAEPGGDGGANIGQAGGEDATSAHGGEGGTQAAGGAKGAPIGGATDNAAAGSRGQGGYGSNHTGADRCSGGGGGGGYYGGGGGGGAGDAFIFGQAANGGGGGGGSGFVGTGTSVTHTRGGGAAATDNGSITIEFNMPPNAPSASIYGETDLDATQPISRTWTFSDPDPADEQSRADIRWRVGVGAWNTIAPAVSDDTGAYDYTAGLFASFVDQQVEDQIKVYDLLGASSAWGASNYFTPRDTPSPPTFASTPTLDSHAPTIDALFPDEAVIVEYRLTTDVAGSPGVDVGGTVLGFGTPVASYSAVLVDDITDMVSGQSYHVLIRYARYGHVWSSWLDSGPVVANINAPLQPVLTAAAIDATVSVVLTIVNPTGDPFPPTHNDIYRQDVSLNSPEERIATGLALNATFTDWAVGLHHTYRYRVAAVSATGASTSSE